MFKYHANMRIFYIHARWVSFIIKENCQDWTVKSDYRSMIFDGYESVWLLENQRSAAGEAR